MFTQRQTDSYDLIGTNARNSNLSICSSKAPFGEAQFANMPFDMFDMAISQQLDQLFFPTQP